MNLDAKSKAEELFNSYRNRFASLLLPAGVVYLAEF